MSVTNHKENLIALHPEEMKRIVQLGTDVASTMIHHSAKLLQLKAGAVLSKTSSKTFSRDVLIVATNKLIQSTL